MAASPAAQRSQFADIAISIFRGNIRVYDAQMESFERLRQAPYPQVEPGQDVKTILSKQLKIQILTSFETLSRVRSEQRRICQDCINRFNQLSKVQNPEEYASFTHYVEFSLSRLEILEQNFLEHVPLLKEFKESSLNGRVVTDISGSLSS